MTSIDTFEDADCFFCEEFDLEFLDDNLRGFLWCSIWDASRNPVRAATALATPIVSLGTYLKDEEAVLKLDALPRKFSSSPACTI